MKTYTYDDSFIQSMKDYAVLGLYPVQIAERMGLKGEMRKQFLHDIHQTESRLFHEYMNSREHYQTDTATVLSDAVLRGDMDALKLEMVVSHQRKVDNLKEELFGI